MKNFIKSFKNKQEKNINEDLIKRKNEKSLIENILDIFKSLEVTGFVTFEGYEIQMREDKINFSKYITTRKKIKKKEKDIRFQYIHPDRCIELTLIFKIHVKDEEALIRKSILIPKMDENNYYTIRGKKYFLLYQLVDNSTYTSRSGLTLKSLMPICINKGMDSITDVEDHTYTVPYYFINIFKREFEGLLIYLCKYGFSETLEYFAISEIFKITTEQKEKNNEKYYYFPLNKNLTLKVRRYFFDKYLLVQSLTLMIKRVILPKTVLEDLESKSYWIQRLGSAYISTSYKLEEVGLSTIAFFERLLDCTTQKNLKLSESNKTDVYSVVKWMMMNFIDLKKKDNLDLDNKRLRLHEYVASLLSKQIGQSINRILTYGNKVELRQVKDVFKFPGTIIFQLLYSSPLLKYDDRVNDLDAFSALRYSVRGPNSLGSRSDRNISIKYRSCHPSYLGKLDLNTCSSSSPGLSGCVSPFAKTDGLWFESAKEAENSEYELYKAQMEYFQKYSDSLIIGFSVKSPEDYYEGVYKMRKHYENSLPIIKDDDDETSLEVSEL